MLTVLSRPLPTDRAQAAAAARDAAAPGFAGATLTRILSGALGFARVRVALFAALLRLAFAARPGGRRRLARPSGEVRAP